MRRLMVAYGLIGTTVTITFGIIAILKYLNPQRLSEFAKNFNILYAIINYLPWYAYLIIAILLALATRPVLTYFRLSTISEGRNVTAIIDLDITKKMRRCLRLWRCRFLSRNQATSMCLVLDYNGKDHPSCARLHGVGGLVNTSAVKPWFMVSLLLWLKSKLSRPHHKKICSLLTLRFLAKVLEKQINRKRPLFWPPQFLTIFRTFSCDAYSAVIHSVAERVSEVDLQDSIAKSATRRKKTLKRWLSDDEVEFLVHRADNSEAKLSPPYELLILITERVTEWIRTPRTPSEVQAASITQFIPHVFGLNVRNPSESSLWPKLNEFAYKLAENLWPEWGSRNPSDWQERITLLIHTTGVGQLAKWLGPRQRQMCLHEGCEALKCMYENRKTTGIDREKVIRSFEDFETRFVNILVVDSKDFDLEKHRETEDTITYILNAAYRDEEAEISDACQKIKKALNAVSITNLTE